MPCSWSMVRFVALRGACDTFSTQPCFSPPPSSFPSKGRLESVCLCPLLDCRAAGLGCLSPLASCKGATAGGSERGAWSVASRLGRVCGSLPCVCLSLRVLRVALFPLACHFRRGGASIPRASQVDPGRHAGPASLAHHTARLHVIGLERGPSSGPRRHSTGRRPKSSNGRYELRLAMVESVLDRRQPRDDTDDLPVRKDRQQQQHTSNSAITCSPDCNLSPPLNTDSPPRTHSTWSSLALSAGLASASSPGATNWACRRGTPLTVSIALAEWRWWACQLGGALSQLRLGRCISNHCANPHLPPSVTTYFILLAFIFP